MHMYLYIAFLILLPFAVIAMPAVALWHPSLHWSLRYLIAAVPAALNYAILMLPEWMHLWGHCTDQYGARDCTVYGIEFTWTLVEYIFLLITLFFIAIPLSLWLALGTLLDQILQRPKKSHR